MSVAERILAFQRELQRRCSSEVEETSYGTAYLHLDFPRRYDSNLVWLDDRGRDADAVSLGADADRALGGRDLVHRQVVVSDDEHGRRLAPGFLELGWSAEHLLVMAWTREPEDRPAAEVVETHFAGAREAIERVQREQLATEDDETIRQLIEVRALFEREGGARFYLGRADGEDAAVCESYTLDGVTQVEDVNTLEAFRGRGLASGIVLTAARAARERGSDLVFLVADDDDWPKQLYGRLGFDPVFRYWSFVRSGA